MRGSLLALATVVTLAACDSGTITAAEFRDLTGQPLHAPSATPAVAATRTPGGPEIIRRPADLSASEPIAPAAPVNLFAGTAAREVANRFAERFGTDPRPLSLVYYPTYAIIHAQDPAEPTHINRYTWRAGQVSQPDPVVVPAAQDIEASLFSLSDVALEAIPQLVEQSVAELAYEQGAATHVIVERNLPFSPDVVIRVYVSGPGNAGRIDYFADGTVMRVFR